MTGLLTGAAPLAAPTLDRLDRFASAALACPVALARQGGVHVLPSFDRARPAWLGYAIPVLGLSYPSGAVLTVRPDLEQALRSHLGSDAERPSWDTAALRRVARAVRRVAPLAYSLAGEVRAVDSASFRPGEHERRAEPVSRDDPAAADLRRRFDGEIFAVRGPRGALLSWAALKRKSDDVWEIAVATVSEHRGRGHARAVVSAATRHTLESGRLCLYVYDHDNRSSAFVCRALGYRPYAEIVLAEY